LEVFETYFDKNVVFTLDGISIATSVDAVSKALLPSIQFLCPTPNVYVSWVTLTATIDKDDPTVTTIVTNWMILALSGICGYGFSYTGKVTGTKCDTQRSNNAVP
jgi:hypothetical protein